MDIFLPAAVETTVQTRALTIIALHARATYALADMQDGKHGWEEAFDAFVPQLAKDWEANDSKIRRILPWIHSKRYPYLREIFPCIVALTRFWNPYCDAWRLARLINLGVGISDSIGEGKSYRWILACVECEYSVDDHAAGEAIYAISGDGTVVFDSNGMAVAEPYRPLPEGANKVALRLRRRQERFALVNDAISSDDRERLLGMTPFAEKRKRALIWFVGHCEQAKTAITALRARKHSWEQAYDAFVPQLAQDWDKEFRSLRHDSWAYDEYVACIQKLSPCIASLTWAWNPNCDAERLAGLINLGFSFVRTDCGDDSYRSIVNSLAEKHGQDYYVRGGTVYAITNDGKVVVDRDGYVEVEPHEPE